MARKPHIETVTLHADKAAIAYVKAMSDIEGCPMKEIVAKAIRLYREINHPNLDQSFFLRYFTTPE